jgi:hypothetical protein
MKLDVKRITEVLKSKSNGPGPEDPLKKLKEALAKQGLEYDAKTKAVRPINPNKPVTKSDVEKTFVDTLQSFNMTPEAFQSMYQKQSSMRKFEDMIPETGDDLKKRLVAEGIFSINKDGDFMPTQKYEQLKKQGMLWKYRL